jgi:phosphonate transport system permease protein
MSTGSPPARQRWQRYTLGQTLARFAVYLGAVAVLAWSLAQVDVYWPWAWDAPRQIADQFTRMYPPDWASMRLILPSLLETVNIAIIATFFGVLMAVPFAFLAARNTTPHPLAQWLGRLVLVSSRSVDTIIWALILVAIFGPGVVAGVLAIAFRSIGFLGKLLSEAIEETDRRPVEAIVATGASQPKVILYGIVPQILPTFFAVTILRWDINIRESTVLGLVGAGGIGMVLRSAIEFLAWPVVAVILLAILAIVAVGEVLAGYLRRRVI